MEVEKIKDQVKKIIKKYLGKDVKIYIYGSFARNEETKTSDLDFAILTKKDIDPLIFSKIKSEIEEIPTLRKIDIVDLRKTNKKFRKKILEYAKILN